MRKSNLFKIIVCGAMFTLLIGSSVLASTITRSAYVRGKETYIDEYEGTVGEYVASASDNFARTTVTNMETTEKLFYCSIEIYDEVNEETYMKSNFADTLATGRNASRGLRRDVNSKQYNYVHEATGFVSTVSSSATLVDRYSFTAKQYYE